MPHANADNAPADHLQIAVHLGCSIFFHGLLDVQDLCLDCLDAELDLQNVPDLNCLGCLGRFAVDQHTASVAGLIGHGSAFDQT